MPRSSTPSLTSVTVPEATTPIAGNRQPYPMTVVIPSLGGDCLGATIAALNRGTVVPAEILLCIPREQVPRAQHLTSSSVRVHPTECRGQVAQRADGFRHAAHPIVMQLDDDLTVAEDCVERLLETLEREGPMVAVSPALIDRDTGESLYKKRDRNGAIEALYYRLINGPAGYEQGRVQRSTGAVGVDPERDRQALYHVQWLPGGCVMHCRDNLVLENYYPFTGKAYCEDIIHSYHLTQRGVRLLIDPRARCGVEAAFDSGLSWSAFVREVAADYRARQHYLSLTNQPPMFLYLFVLVRYLAYGVHRLAAANRPAPVKSR